MFIYTKLNLQLKISKQIKLFARLKREEALIKCTVLGIYSKSKINKTCKKDREKMI